MKDGYILDLIAGAGVVFDFAASPPVVYGAARLAPAGPPRTAAVERAVQRHGAALGGLPARTPMRGLCGHGNDARRANCECHARGAHNPLLDAPSNDVGVSK